MATTVLFKGTWDTGEPERINLSELCHPLPPIGNHDETEELRARVAQLEEIVGKLAELLYENTSVPLEDLVAACGQHGEIEPVE